MPVEPTKYAGGSLPTQRTWAAIPVAELVRADEVDAEIGAQITTFDGTLGDLAALDTVGSDQVDAAAVTYAKIQNVSAADKILGRSTAGAGTVEEITCTPAGRALLDDAAATNQRDTLGLGGSATLDVGTGAGTVAAGNDSRLPTFDQKSALAGTGTPGSSDKFVNESTLGGSATLEVGTSVGTVAAGDDSRLPTSDQKSALAGTGTPSASDKFVNESTLAGALSGWDYDSGWVSVATADATKAFAHSQGSTDVKLKRIQFQDANAIPIDVEATISSEVISGSGSEVSGFYGRATDANTYTLHRATNTGYDGAGNVHSWRPGYWSRAAAPAGWAGQQPTQVRLQLKFSV